MNPEEKLHLLLDAIVASLSLHTKQPDISLETGNSHYTMSFRVDPRDQGRLVGKKGTVIWAIQTLFWYAGLTLAQHPCQIKLLEPENPQRDLPPQPFRFNKKWDRNKIKDLVSIIISSTLPQHATAFVTEIDDTTAKVVTKVEAYLKTPISEPSFLDAFDTILHAAGMRHGAKITTEAIFT